MQVLCCLACLVCYWSPGQPHCSSPVAEREGGGRSGRGTGRREEGKNRGRSKKREKGKKGGRKERGRAHHHP